MERSAVGYIRVSTEEQAKNGESLEVQAKRIRAYCEANNLHLVTILADEGVTGTTLDREGMQQLNVMVSTKQVGHVVLMKIDRLSRRTLDVLSLIESVFVPNQIQFHSVEEKIDTTTAAGRVFLTMVAAFSQMERDLISERTSVALQNKREKGERLGTTPLGYKPGGGDLVPDVEELQIVQEVQKLHKEGSSLRSIARTLTAHGYPTKRGGKWYASTVRAILKHHGCT